jgi:CheY-like chemotaxis protein
MKFDKIILVDDNPTTIFYNTDIISDFDKNAQILSFQNELEFLKFIDKENKTLKDENVLLLMDINMPNNTGFEIIAELEENYDTLNNFLTLIVTSSNLKSDYEKATRFQQIKGYIEKPLTVEKLSSVLKDKN